MLRHIIRHILALFVLVVFLGVTALVLSIVWYYEMDSKTGPEVWIKLEEVGKYEASRAAEEYQRVTGTGR